MFVEAIMALVRMSDTGEVVVADLAKAILILVVELRETTQRAELAEAGLEAEIHRVEEIRQKIAEWSGDNPADMSRVLREIAEVISA